MEYSLVAAAAEKILSDLGTPRQAIDATEPAWRNALWDALESNGLTLAWVPEALGGSGVELAEGFEIVKVAGHFALPVPLVETMLAGWLLASADIPSPAGPMSIAPARPSARITLDGQGQLQGRANHIPFASEAVHFAVHATGDDGNHIALVAAADCQIEQKSDLSGEPRDSVSFDNVRPIAINSVDFEAERLMLMGGVLRALQTAGALQSALDLSVEYAGERVAFGKPIGKFQAVQINLARMAGEVAAANAAATSAVDAIVNARSWDDGLFLEAVAAKIRSAEAAEEGMLIAHQVHGAIGVTLEHVLHRFSLRAMAWRDDFGNESYWARELGRRIAAKGSDSLWELVASR